ncbi:membrane protein insertion efficiency factor YidD [Candidatus Daviesbacteria bacterium]|nr:membrane protein insertion efficiency factor YidD [Candidatus Daviesbacteria bacterium]
MKSLLVALINYYQTYLSFDKGILALFAPGGACRYNPSCSQYLKQMIKEYGALKGLGLGLKRIWSCK